jgi:hypothetical protein
MQYPKYFLVEVLPEVIMITRENGDFSLFRFWT